MPIYRFHIDVDVPPHMVAQRLKAIVHKGPTFWESLRTGWWWRLRYRTGPPFIGTVQDDSFRVRRDIQGRNSFLPLVCGRFVSTPTGTSVSVTMFLHPLVALFMVIWLGVVGRGALVDRSAPHAFLWGMFIFGVALTAGGFIPEAIKARRLISETLRNATINAVQQQTPVC